MQKRSLFVLSILTSTLFNGTAPTQALPVTPAANLQVQPAATVTLTLQDLPAGFQEIPAEIKPQITARLEPFKQLLAQEDLPLENFFAFVNTEKLEVVMGFTGMLSNQSQKAKFDATVQQVQQPEARRQLMSKVKERLQYQGIKLIEHQTLPQLNNIGDTSTGVSLALAVQKQPLRVDMGGFRRGSVGAFTAILYLDKTAPMVPVRDIVTKLDNRILQFSPAVNSSRSQ